VLTVEGETSWRTMLLGTSSARCSSAPCRRLLACAICTTVQHQLAACTLITSSNYSVGWLGCNAGSCGPSGLLCGTFLSRAG
jgi:hypothetical protein